jgi:hypothetical protein
MADSLHSRSAIFPGESKCRSIAKALIDNGLV